MVLRTFCPLLSLILTETHFTDEANQASGTFNNLLSATEPEMYLSDSTAYWGLGVKVEPLLGGREAKSLSWGESLSWDHLLPSTTQ